VRLVAVGAAVVAFLAASAAVARVIGAATAARGEVTDTIKQRAGGEVDILRVDGISGFAPGGRIETARVAWKAAGRLPVVQCVRVRRTGDPLAGYDTAVLSVSRPIGREASCPD
jgi:hypothetical protein